MNPKPDNERLLGDVFSEAAPAGFRKTTLERTLHLVRRRRRWRQTRRAAFLLTVLGTAALLLWPQVTRRPKTRPLAELRAEKNYQVVRTESLPAGAMVTTQPLSSEEMATSAARVEMVQTPAHDGGIQVISDDELLELVAPRTAALVRGGPHSMRLVFADPENEKGFPVD